MKTKKLNFSEMKNALTRSEMKQIMAGSGASCPLKCSSADCVGSCECHNNGTANEYCGTH